MKTISQILICFLCLSYVATYAQVGKNQGVANPNLASKEDLTAIAYVTEELAQKIIDQRPFITMMDFHKLVSASLNESQCEEVCTNLFVPINLNTASREEILLVPKVGDRMAHEFEEYRPYRKIAQFRREMSKYVDDDEVERLEQYVFVPLDLNTASEEEILTIPGVGNRMAHEFEEYRPYKNLAQFRKEIGKYVDEEEVARLERYVVISE